MQKRTNSTLLHKFNFTLQSLIMMMMGTVVNGNNIGSDQNNNSEDLVLPLPALRMVEKELEVLIIRTFQRVIEPMMGNLIRKVVKEEIELAQEKLSLNMIQNVNKEASTSRSGSLELKFLDKVATLVLTGKEIRGEGGAPISIALVEVSTGRVVDNGPEASMKVEVVVREADHKGHPKLDKNVTAEREKKKPFLSGNIIYLKEGVGHLANTKIKHDKSWMRSCECMLVARIVDNLGIRVQEAKTTLFTVMDSRNRLYEKHYPPSLSDDVWRLENISRNGALHRRLNEVKIITVKDFLVSLFLDPEKLRKILDTNSTTWKVLIEHAQKCEVDEKVHSYFCGEAKAVVVFDAVGRLQGVLRNCQYIPVGQLSEAEKAEMLKSIASAFKHWKDVTTFDNEASLLHSLSYTSSGIFNQNIPRLGSPSGSSFISYETSHAYDLIQPGTSSQFEGTSSLGDLGSHSAYNCFDNQALDVLDQCPDFPSFDLGMVVDDFGFYDQTWLLSFDNDSYPQSEDHGVQYSAHQQINKSDIQLGEDEGPSCKKAKKRWRMVAVSMKKRSIRKRYVNSIEAHAQKKPRHS